LGKEEPDCVLVYGDTNSTLAGALAAAKLHFPVAHVEAGLRSFNRRMPEEINRIVADCLSAVLFAPTTTAVENLGREGISQDRIHLVGDVMYDAALYFACRAETHSPLLRACGLASGEYVLATIHRAENTDFPQRLQAIMEGLVRVARDTKVVLPLHPRTRHAVARCGITLDGNEGLIVLEPQGYLDMLMLEKNAAVIVTDSGGVQKEAYFCRVPCVTLRDETAGVEWTEQGANLLCSADAQCVEAAVRASRLDGFPAAAPVDLYGDGQAARRIAAVLAAGRQ
jgi:UDP-GlcNAc3NAcA epimerase